MGQTIGGSDIAARAMLGALFAAPVLFVALTSFLPSARNPAELEQIRGCYGLGEAEVTISATEVSVSYAHEGATERASIDGISYRRGYLLHTDRSLVVDQSRKILMLKDRGGSSGIFVDTESGEVPMLVYDIGDTAQRIRKSACRRM